MAYCQQNSCYHRQCAEGAQRIGYGQLRLEYIEEEAQKGIDAYSLDQNSREHGRYGRWGRRVCIRKPGVERNGGRFQAESCDENHLNKCDKPRFTSGSKLAGHIGHVERPGVPIQQGYAEYNQKGSDPPKHLVLEGSLEFLPAYSEGHKRVSGDDRDFQKDEQVEQIACEHYAIHAAGHQTEQNVKLRIVLVGLHVSQRVAGRRKSNGVDDGKHDHTQWVGYHVNRDRDPGDIFPAANPVDHYIRRFPNEQEGAADGKQKKNQCNGYFSVFPKSGAG